MPRWLHIILQIATIGVGVAGHVYGIPLIPIIATALSASIGVINQAYNTDGTPQETAFIPKNQQQIIPKPPNQ